jgi:hypothetical protein
MTLGPPDLLNLFLPPYCLEQTMPIAWPMLLLLLQLHAFAPSPP